MLPRHAVGHGESHLKVTPQPLCFRCMEISRECKRSILLFFIGIDSHLKLFGLHTIIVTQSRERIGNRTNRTPQEIRGFGGCDSYPPYLQQYFVVLYTAGSSTSYPDRVPDGIRLHFLGGAREVGNVGCVIEDKTGTRVLIDYGLAPTKPPKYPSEALS